MSLLTEIHNYVRGARRLIDLGNTNFPHDPKRYSRMPQIALAPPSKLAVPLTDVLAKRSSAHRYAEVPVTTSQLSELFGHALKIRPDHRRPYPSGGGLYPIETYFLAFNIDTLPRGVFHYRPTSHALEHLWDLAASDMPSTFVNAECEHAAGLFIFTSFWERSAQKYRDFAYNLALIEAGHLCQNLILTAGALNLAMRPLAAFNDRVVADALDIDMRHEQPIYSALLGSMAHT